MAGLILLLLGILTLPAVGTAHARPLSRQQDRATRVAAYCDSGSAMLERGDLTGARRQFEQALRLDRDAPRALLGMGRTLLEDPKGGQRALDYLTRATVVLPTDPAAHYYRALAHVRLAHTDVGSDNARAALKELDLVLALDPSHSDAHYQRGIILREIDRDFGGAEDAFRTQMAANPAHRESRIELLKTLVDLADWDKAVETAEDLLSRDPGFAEAYPYMAASHWRAGRGEEAMRVFERYFGVVPREEVELYLDLGMVLTTSERREFAGLDSDGRRSYWAHYWSTRDPDPKTAVNERLLEHYIRVAWSRIEFGEQEWPWDARGEFYVRYGEPDVRTGRYRPFAEDLIDDDPLFLDRKREFERSMGLPYAVTEETVTSSSRQGFVDASAAPGEASAFAGSVERAPERWVYMERGVDVVFRDPIGRGKYLVESDRHRMLVERMAINMPTMSPEEDKIELIDPMDSVVTFRGENGATAVEYSFALIPDEFGAFRSITGAYATVDVEVKLFTEDWTPVAQTGEKARRLQTIPQVQIRGIPLFVDATRMEVDPGTYRLTTFLLDPESGRRATAEEIIELPDYSGDQLMVSGILPAARIQEVGPGRTGRFIRGEMEVLPLPGRALQVDQPLFIYYEIYNLTKDPIGATDYEIAYSVAEAPEDRALVSRLFQGLASLVGRGRQRAVLTSTVPRTGIREQESAYLEIGLNELPADTYIIEMTVTDKLSGQTASSALYFRTLPIR
jgi:GWxTD domain-containing protein